MVNEELLHQLFELSIDVMYSVSIPDGLILALSPAFTGLTGWPAEDWIGRAFMDLIHPDDRKLAMEAFKMRANGKEPGPTSLKILTRNKGDLIAEFTSALVKIEGRPTSIIGIARNVTERKMIEDELGRRSRQVLHILESITDGVYLLDNEWRYVMLNDTAEELTGKSSSELIGKVFWEVRSPETVKALSQKFREAKETSKVVVFEEADLSARKWYEIRAYPHVDGLAVYFTDISLRKRTEEQLKKHSEGVEKILGDILGIQEKWS